MFTLTQDLQFSDYKTRILVVKLNGGTMTIQKKVGTNWIVADTITADGAYQMIFGTGIVRFVGTGSCQYEVEQ